LIWAGDRVFAGGRDRWRWCERAERIEVVTRADDEAAKERNLPRAIIVNKIDLPDLDLEKLVKEPARHVRRRVLPINLPSPGRKAVVECLLNNSGEAEV